MKFSKSDIVYISFVNIACVIILFSNTLSKKRLLTKWNARSLTILPFSLWIELMWAFTRFYEMLSNFSRLLGDLLVTTCFINFFKIILSYWISKLPRTSWLSKNDSHGFKAFTTLKLYASTHLWSITFYLSLPVSSESLYWNYSGPSVNILICLLHYEAKVPIISHM